jgi:hypothetical protein
MEEVFTLDNFRITDYYPYTSIVTMRILESGDSDCWLKNLWDEIEKFLEKKGIMPDNKVAVRMVVKDDIFCRYGTDYVDGGVYVGSKDGIVSIGFGVWQPEEYTKKHNKHF